MILPSVLNIALGLFFVYLLLSLLVSDVQELLSTLFWDSRAKHLYDSIAAILGENFAKLLYRHPLINSLQDYKVEQGKHFKGPSYIPEKIFAIAFLDSLLEKTSIKYRAVDLQAQQFTEALESSSVQEILSANNIKMFKVLAVQAELKQSEFNTYLEALESEIMQWFQQAMKRTSGVYKRQVKWRTFLIGLICAITLNADSLNIANQLYQDPVLQNQFIEIIDQVYQNQTLAYLEDSEENSQLEASPKFSPDLAQFLLDFSELPIGWSSENVQAQFSLNINNSDSEAEIRDFPTGGAIAQALLGWILTAIAISMGASFWFDLLKKFVNVRNTGNK